MINSIQIKLSKIKCGGDSVGRDIRIGIEVLGKFLRIDKRIKAGATVEINREIGRFEIDRGLFQIEVFITVIEKDLLFNDVGSMNGNIKINTALAKQQRFVFEVQIKKARSVVGKFWSKKAAAVFEITLEAEVSDAIRYVSDEASGWLRVLLEENKSKVDLPAFLKVKIERLNNKREYFTILEGTYRNKLASVIFRDDNSSWLISGIKHESMVRLTYSISKKILTLKDRKYQTIDYPKVPWKKGLYDIEIPDYPHRGGANYPEAQRAKTWFKIGHSGERYLHIGGRSLGCMTVIETKRWMEIYNALIKARKGDFMSIGVIEVID
ncbi:MAG: hypothetical protein C0412_17230 [Flavobacterium sp.]|nr:hypothetical protein [Flavobacterium sp.]